MSKFHINSSGQTAPCRATKGKCPFGGVDGKSNHFDTREEAQKFLDTRGSEDYGVLPGMSNIPFGKEDRFLNTLDRARKADGEFVRVEDEDGKVIEGMFYEHEDGFEIESADGKTHSIKISKVKHFEQLTNIDYL